MIPSQNLLSAKRRSALSPSKLSGCALVNLSKGISYALPLPISPVDPQGNGIRAHHHEAVKSFANVWITRRSASFLFGILAVVKMN